MTKQRVTEFRVAGSDTKYARPKTVLLTNLSGPDHLVECEISLWIRLGTRVLSPSLDQKLAEGTPPESNRLLATRAAVLVAPQARRELAANWTGLVHCARQLGVARSRRIRIDSEAVIATESDIVEMCELLASPFPSPVRGVAMASNLLSDGTGPLYNHRSGDGLLESLRTIIASLDPQTSVAG